MSKEKIRSSLLYSFGSAKNPVLREDGWFFEGQFSGVIDGMSALYHPDDGPMLFDGSSGGQMICRIAQEFAANYARQIQPLGERREHLRRFLECMNIAIMNWRKKAGFLSCEPVELPGACFLFVWIGDRYIHLAQGGDCLAAWEFRDGRRGATSNYVFPYTAEVQCEVRRLMRKYRGDRSRMWEDLLPFERAQKNNYTNQPGGWADLNGDDALLRGVRFARLDRFLGLRRLLIFTDGFVPFEVTASPEGIAGYVLDYYHQGNCGKSGLRAVLRETRKVQEKNSKRSHVSFPEATAIAFEF